MSKLNPYNHKIRKKIFRFWEKELKKDKKYVPYFPPKKEFDVSLYKGAKVLIKDLESTEKDLKQIEGIKISLPTTYNDVKDPFANIVDKGYSEQQTIDIGLVSIPLNINQEIVKKRSVWMNRLNKWLDQL